MCSLANDTVNKRSTHIPTRVHVCMCVCVCAYTRRGKHSTHIFTRAHVCVCVCVCVCIHAHLTGLASLQTHRGRAPRPVLTPCKRGCAGHGVCWKCSQY